MSMKEAAEKFVIQISKDLLRAAGEPESVVEQYPDSVLREAYVYAFCNKKKKKPMKRREITCGECKWWGRDIAIELVGYHPCLRKLEVETAEEKERNACVASKEGYTCILGEQK